MSIGKIYIVRNLLTSACYIGQTVRSLETRWARHVADSITPHSHFHRAIQKYGSVNFSIELLHECAADILNDAEVCWIAFAHSVDAKLYNETCGGDGARGYKQSEEHIRKRTEKTRGRTVSIETREKIAQKIRGTKYDDARRKRISEAVKCRPRKPMSQVGRQNIAASQKGRKLSDEHRANIGKSHRGKVKTAEHRQKLSESRRGKSTSPLSEEHRQKLSEAQRIRRARERKALEDKQEE